jgi:hypothetical protein
MGRFRNWHAQLEKRSLSEADTLSWSRNFIWKPKAHCRIHKSFLSFGPNPFQRNQVPTLQEGERCFRSVQLRWARLSSLLQVHPVCRQANEATQLPLLQRNPTRGSACSSSVANRTSTNNFIILCNNWRTMMSSCRLRLLHSKSFLKLRIQSTVLKNYLSIGLWDINNPTLYKQSAQMVVRLSALRTRRTLLPRNIIILMLLVLIYIRGWVNPRA